MLANLIKTNQQTRNLEEVREEEGQERGHLGTNYCNLPNVDTHLKCV